MSKSLKIIQTIVKVGTVLSMIVFVGGIVGVAGCLLGILGVAVGLDQIIKFGGVTLRGVLENDVNLSPNQMYLALSVGAIACVAAIVMGWLAYRYCRKELKAGTPFTYQGAHDMLVLGIVTLAVSLSLTSVITTVIGIANACALTIPNEPRLDANVGMGLMLMALSVVFKYGAETSQNKTPTPDEPAK